MGLRIVSFTENGMHLSERIAEELGTEEVEVFTKWSAAEKNGARPFVRYIGQGIREWAGEQMKERNSLLFIGACGIAVRAIAPFLTDKLHDSPVLVMDEKGKFIVPILSGHMGGADELAVRLAKGTGAVPVLTAATDINKKFAVDVFAKRNGLYITDKDGIKAVSAKVLAGEKITVSVETGHLEERTGKPEEVILVPYPPVPAADVVVAAEEERTDGALLLKPREYVIGMGCRRGKETEKIEAFAGRLMGEAGISEDQIFALASIDRKKQEEGLLAWSRKRNIPFLTFPAEELEELVGSFHSSTFVMEQTGVGNVCERAALKACGPGGKLVFGKHAEDGMTIAAAKREWSVSFGEK